MSNLSTGIAYTSYTDTYRYIIRINQAYIYTYTYTCMYVLYCIVWYWYWYWYGMVCMYVYKMYRYIYRYRYRVQKYINYVHICIYIYLMTIYICIYIYPYPSFYTYYCSILHIKTSQAPFRVQSRHKSVPLEQPLPKRAPAQKEEVRHLRSIREQNNSLT